MGRRKSDSASASPASTSKRRKKSAATDKEESNAIIDDNARAPEDGKIRCSWAKNLSIRYQKYHDEEWGVPSRDDTHLFEMLILEGAQAGLSWSTILQKRDRYREVYHNWDVRKVSQWTDTKISEVLQDPGIVRNKLKVSSSVTNAQQFIEVQKEFGTFSKYLWAFVPNGKPIVNRFKTLQDYPAKTPLSEKISTDLRKRGFRFVGPTIIYAFLQAVGVVNDHSVDCFLHKKKQ